MNRPSEAASSSPAHAATPFDERAATWDADPAKVTRALAVAAAIRSQVPPERAMRVLEYGCGTGLLGFALQPHCGSITLADSSSGMLATLQGKIAASGASNLRALRLDLVSDPLPPERFDLICSLMTFHHIADTARLLRDLYTLLDSPGHLCVADLDAEDGSFHGPGFTGHQGFARAALAREAQEAGFHDVGFSTVFHVAKPDSPGQTDFPIFLMIARK
ncbi:MAG: class I SAM-dependent methyltransferase [Candidatus Accumulibacter sp.]|nr:class I SAM-dependent methyltransferase [Accumulibacter sp.]HRD89403.1 class I SAM-dependent methyltransferase [Accumulibacter sp.]